jgi:hypothetical protein
MVADCRRVTPDLPPAAEYDRLARSLVEAGRFAEAEEAVRTADLLEPGGTDRLLVLAAAQAGLGHRGQARRSLFAVLAREPGHQGARQALAGLSAPAARAARQRGNRAMTVPALVMVLFGGVFLLLRVPVAGVTCLVLGVVLLLGGFPGNRSERRP